ncbi:TPA: hypothetical protein MIP05_17170 [Klebsiella pneumoniae]|nr:hypothetical protein [Klebsiella pneumoniae]
MDLFYFISLFLFDFIVYINVIILQFTLRIYILRGDFLNCFCYAIFCVMRYLLENKHCAFAIFYHLVGN